MKTKSLKKLNILVMVFALTLFVFTKMPVYAQVDQEILVYESMNPSLNSTEFRLSIKIQGGLNNKPAPTQFKLYGEDFAETKELLEHGILGDVLDFKVDRNKYTRFFVYVSEPDFDVTSIQATLTPLNKVVSLDAMGGSFNDGTQTIEFEHQLDEELTSNTDYQIPRREGYRFQAWHTADNRPYRFNEMEIEDLYAKWESVGTFQLSLVYPNQTIQKTLTEDQSLTQILDEHHDVIWFYDAQFTVPFDTTKHSLTEDLTLYAQYTESSDALIKIAFDSAGGSVVNSIDVLKDSYLSEPQAPIKEGFTFAGWYVDDQQWNFDVDRVVDPLVLTAQWLMNTYTVTFDTHEGGVIEPLTEVVHGSSIAKPLEPIKLGASFAGWYRDAAFEQPWDFLVDTVENTMTLYAKWDEPGYTVVFHSVGGDEVTALVDISHGSLITPPEQLHKEGYSFEGWYSDESYLLAWDFNEHTVVSNLNLFAKWRINTYTVTFNSNQGSNVPSFEQVNHGDSILKPIQPERKGHSFDGWYHDRDLTQVFNFETDTVVNSQTLYAKWRKLSYTVEFNTLGGTAIAPLHNIEYGSFITHTEKPQKQGYIFKGWLESISPQRTWNFALNSIESNHVLYALWEKDPGGVKSGTHRPDREVKPSQLGPKETKSEDIGDLFIPEDKKDELVVGKHPDIKTDKPKEVTIEDTAQIERTKPTNIVFLLGLTAVITTLLSASAYALKKYLNK